MLVRTSSKVDRPWGNYRVVFEADNFWTKALTIYGGESLSLHLHEHRQVFWYPMDVGLRGLINGGSVLDLIPGTVYSVPQNIVHRIINPTGAPLRLIEVAFGAVDEADIIRIYDKYGS